MNDASHSRFSDATKPRVPPEPNTAQGSLGTLEACVSSATTLAVLRRAALIFLPLALITAAVLSLLYRAQTDAAQLITQANERNTVVIGESAALAELSEVASDLIYVSEQSRLREWLQAGNAAATGDLAGDFLAFAKYKTLYDQVRLIGIEGNEVIRVDWDGGAPRIVPPQELKNTADRYDVHETLDLEPEQIFISPLDLNVEHGVIEQPLKPTIRFGLAVYDGRGHKRGVIVIHYLAQRLLDRLGASSAGNPGDTWLLNSDGYWLLGSKDEDEWGFMFPARHERSFARAYPAAWKTIMQSRASGQFNSDGALFTFEKVALSDLPRLGSQSGYTAPKAPSWILVKHVSARELGALQPAVERKLVFAGGTIILLFAVASFLAAHHWSARQAFEQAARRSESKIVKLNERLLRDNAALEGLDRELEAFSYSVSHDLRAPLRAIDGFAQALTEDYAGQLDERGQGYLSRVRHAAQHMGTIIDDLLSLSRVARAEVNTQDVDLSALAEEISLHLKQSEPTRQAEFVVAPSSARARRLGAPPPRHRQSRLERLEIHERPFARADRIRARNGQRRAGLFRARQRRGLRHGVRRKALRRVSAAPRRGLSRDGNRSRDRATHHSQARRTHLGPGRTRDRRRLLFYPT